ncbi:MAG: cellulase family glycosylhydrolase [Chitinispirillales bacterium]|jgi:endoglucanase|nr:cellulase family glycosylhydrolase [Chitinispirillales bacterium]
MRRISKITTIAVLMASWAFLAAAQTPPPGSPVATHGQLSVDGNRIVNSRGEPVQLRGMSLYWSIGGGVDFYTAAVVQHLRSDWQADVVRAAMAVERNFNNEQRGFIADPEGNRSRLLTVVNAAIAQGMYVIIDWHSYIAEINQQQAVTFFKAMATQFKGVPNVIYEIYNEPNGICGPSGQNPCPGFTAAQNGGTALPSNRNPHTPWGVIRGYMQAVTDSIRAIDPDNLILIGTPDWCQRPDIATATGSAITGKNLVYTAHFYAGQNDPAHRGDLRNRIMAAMDRGFPVFVSEFGLTNAQGTGALDLDETTRWLDFLDFHHIGWANWSITNLGETSGAIQSGNGLNPSQWQLKPSGTYMRNRLRAPRSTTTPFRLLRVRSASVDGSEVPSHTIAVSVNNVNTTNGGTHTYVVDPNVNAAVTVIPPWSNPAIGTWRFIRWEGDTQGATPGATPTVLNVPMNNINRTITAVFEYEPVIVSTLPHGASAPAVRWSVARSGNGLILAGPSAAEASLYNMRGKQIGRFTYDGSGRALAIGGQNMPAGRYMVVVRDIATGREVYRDRVMMVR